MRRTIFSAILFAAGISCLIATLAVGGEQLNFSLAVGQGVRVADYTVTFQGVIGGVPAYNLLGRGGMLARFPLDPATSPAPYTYGNLSITTNTVSPDGKQAIGTVKIE